MAEFHQNFSIGKQVEKEIQAFTSQRVRLARPQKDGTIRYLKKGNDSYDFNQGAMINTIDLYYNSQFEDGPEDTLGQRKIFMNVGKFRTLVAAKQINLDTKDFKFLPDDYADPWTAFFLQKEFREWAKETNWGELLNEVIEKLPRYGTVVLKKVGKEIRLIPLQNLKNDQRAKSLKESPYVIEQHPQMYVYEIMDMPGWNTAGLRLRYDDQIDVEERYGYVPLSWFKRQKNGMLGPTEQLQVFPGDEMQSIYVMAVVGKVGTSSINHDGWWTFYLEQAECPYRETHWDRQHGRWLGIGVMEDLIENQIAANIGVNIWRRSLHWSAKRVLQSPTTDMIEKNLVRDVQDGEVLEIGAGNEIKQVDLTAKNAVEMQQFMSAFSGNADQKAFTYDIVTGSLASHTPYRLAIILAQAVASYYSMRKETLGMFLKETLTEFAIPDFLRDMGNEERVIAMFGDEPGFNALKAATIQWVKSETARVAILSGRPVDSALLDQAAGQFANVKQLFIKIPESYYMNAKYKFDLDVTGEEINNDERIKNLTALYQAMMAQGDSRAGQVLDRILALQGQDVDEFGPAPAPIRPTMTPTQPVAPQPVPTEIPSGQQIHNPAVPTG